MWSSGDDLIRILASVDWRQAHTPHWEQWEMSKSKINHLADEWSDRAGIWAIERFQNTHTHARGVQSMLPHSERASTKPECEWGLIGMSAGPKVRWIHPALRLMREPARASRPCLFWLAAAPRPTSSFATRRIDLHYSSLASLSLETTLLPEWKKAGCTWLFLAAPIRPRRALRHTLHRGRFTLSRLKNVRWLLLTFSVKLSGDDVIYLHYACWLKKQFQLTFIAYKN